MSAALPGAGLIPSSGALPGAEALAGAEPSTAANSAASLARLLSDPRLWRAGSTRSQRAAEPTGLADLDAFLPTGGWPQSALSEILFAADGQGELSLVLPLLARLSEGRGRIVLIAPPYRPYAPALAQCGIELDALVIVEAPPKQALWAAEQCLRAGCCAAVLCWPDAARADERALRRLQLAAEAGHSLGIAFRPLRAASQTSPAALRLTLDAEGELRVLKARGANPPPRGLRWRQHAQAPQRPQPLQNTAARRIDPAAAAGPHATHALNAADATAKCLPAAPVAAHAPSQNVAAFARPRLNPNSGTLAHGLCADAPSGSAAPEISPAVSAAASSPATSSLSRLSPTSSSPASSSPADAIARAVAARPAQGELLPATHPIPLQLPLH